MVIQARQKMIKMANTHIIDSSQCFKARASLFSLIELVWTNSQRQTKDDDDERFFFEKIQIVNKRLRLAPINQRIVTNTQKYLYKDLLNNCNFQLLRCFPRNNHRKEVIKANFLKPRSENNPGILKFSSPINVPFVSSLQLFEHNRQI